MPDDESSDLFPGLVAEAPPPLVAPTEPVISIQATASKSSRSSPMIPRWGAISCCWFASTTVVSSETFTLDPKTLRRSGRALQSSPKKRSPPAGPGRRPQRHPQGSRLCPDALDGSHRPSQLRARRSITPRNQDRLRPHAFAFWGTSVNSGAETSGLRR